MDSPLPFLHTFHGPLLTTSKLSFLKYHFHTLYTCSSPSLLFRSLSLASKGSHSWPQSPFPIFYPTPETSRTDPFGMSKQTKAGTTSVLLGCAPQVPSTVPGARGMLTAVSAQWTEVCKCNLASENIASHSLVFLNWDPYGNGLEQDELESLKGFMC